MILTNGTYTRHPVTFTGTRGTWRLSSTTSAGYSAIEAIDEFICIETGERMECTRRKVLELYMEGKIK